MNKESKVIFKDQDTFSHVPALDGVRGVAILLVISWHFIGNALSKDNFILKKIKLITGAGWSGVDLFFVLSGYLITTILLKNIQSSNYFRTFYIRRLFRLLPIYYLLVLAFIILANLKWEQNLSGLFKNAMPLWTYILFVQNFPMAYLKTFGADWLNVTWTIAVEVQFYITFSLFLKYIDKKYLPYVLLALIIICPAIRYYINSWFPNYILLLCRIDSFAMGALLAYFQTEKGILPSLKSAKKSIYLIFILLIFGYILNEVYGIFNLNHTFLGLIFTVFIILALVGKNFIASVLCNPILREIGTVSYGMYLYHTIILAFTYHIFREKISDINHLSNFIIISISFLATFLLSYLSYNFVERPLIKYSQSFKY